MQITTVGLDLAQHIFQVHAVDGPAKPWCGNGCAEPSYCRP
jgi:hypothetical protein